MISSSKESHGTMPFAIRPLKAADIPQSVKIEREAFPRLIPPTAFHRELENHMASFLVACRRREDMDNGRHSPAALGGGKGGRKDSLVGTLLENLKDSWNEWSAGLRDGQDLIVGFLGTWRMVKEAHIVSVGVRKRYRGQGIGELLLRGAIEQAKALGAEVVTLEVRPSNQVAISLYKKYGFTERGLRKGYYADNREDALIMTTDHIHLPSYRDLFRRLEREHQRRWGQAELELF